MFWSFVLTHVKPDWLFLPGVRGLPPEVEGLGEEQGFTYLLENFPYPLVEYVFVEFVAVTALIGLVGDDKYKCQLNVPMRLGKVVQSRRTRYPCYIMVFPSLHLLLSCANACKALFAAIRNNFACHYIKVLSCGNIAVLMLGYNPVACPLIPSPKCIMYGSYSTDQPLEFFKACDYKWGQFSEELVHTAPTHEKVRRIFLDYGVTSDTDISHITCQQSRYKRYEAIQFALECVSTPIKAYHKDALYYVAYTIGSARGLSIQDRLFLRKEAANTTARMWDMVKFSSELDEPPALDEPTLRDFIIYIYKWLFKVFTRCPLLFFCHLCAVLCGLDNRKRLLVMWGEPYAGKSTLFGHISKILNVHRLVLLRQEDFDRQLAYSTGKDFVLFDDAAGVRCFVTFVCLAESNLFFTLGLRWRTEGQEIGPRWPQGSDEQEVRR